MKQYTIQELKTEFLRLGYEWFDFHNIAIRSKANVQNRFDDLLGYIDGDKIVWHTGTTNAGTKPLLAPTHPDGVAVVCLGQYKNSWRFHFHKGKYLCLGQCRPVDFQRDNDKDKTAESQGKVYSEVRGFNWHRANEKAESTFVENWSEGCLVRNNPVQYDTFMSDCIKHYEVTTGKKFDIKKLPTDFEFTGTILEEF